MCGMYYSDLTVVLTTKVLNFLNRNHQSLVHRTDLEVYNEIRHKSTINSGFVDHFCTSGWSSPS